MRIAARYPQKVLATVLCDTAHAIGTVESWNERISTVELSGMTTISEAIVERWVSPEYRARRPADFAGWRNMARALSEGGICGGLRDRS